MEDEISVVMSERKGLHEQQLNKNRPLWKIITEERYAFDSCFDQFIPFRTKETVITIFKSGQDVKLWKTFCNIFRYIHCSSN